MNFVETERNVNGPLHYSTYCVLGHHQQCHIYYIGTYIYIQYYYILRPSFTVKYFIQRHLLYNRRKAHSGPNNWGIISFQTNFKSRKDFFYRVLFVLMLNRWRRDKLNYNLTENVKSDKWEQQNNK